MKKSRLYEIINEMKKIIKEDKVGRICGYGNVGDGKMNLNVKNKKFENDVMKIIEKFVFEWK
jgi:hypothetical protein